jgi:NAD-dependent deacetylase
MSPLEHLCAAVDAARDGTVLVVTGAGVSLASGIPTYRGTDENATWTVSSIKYAQRIFFERRPGRAWAWHIARRDAMRHAKPNAAHRAVAALERWQVARGGDFLLVTQNIDGLHVAAGSSRCVAVHGDGRRARCTREGCAHAAPRGSIAFEEEAIVRFLRRPVDANAPRCPACRAPLRPHVLFFDEYYASHEDYEIGRVREALDRARVVVCAGTSFSVGVTALVVERARARGVALFDVDPGARDDAPGSVRVREAAEVALPALAERLGAAA